MRGHCSNASTLPGGSPTFSTRRDSRRRPLIRSAGWDPLVPISVGAIPTRIMADASGECVSGACGSRPRRYRSASGVPAASVQARNSRGPGSHCWRHHLDRPTCPVAGDTHQPRIHRRAHQRGVLVGAGDLRLAAPRRRSSRRAPRRATADPRPPTAARLVRSGTRPAPPGPRQRASRSGRRPRAAPTQPRRTTADSRKRQ